MLLSFSAFPGLLTALSVFFLAFSISAAEAQKSKAHTSAITLLSDKAGEKIGNGVPTSNYPAVGLLLIDGSPSCTGTLISPIHFLTAQHCVRRHRAPAYTVFFQHAGLFFVLDDSKIFKPSSKFRLEDLCGSQSDIAVIQLDRPVLGIAPMPINTVTSSLQGSSGSIVGFGFNKPEARPKVRSGDLGIKREGKVDLGPCKFAPACTIPTNELVCWNIPAGKDLHNTCPGDPGGPLFIHPRLDNLVAGVTSSGVERLCASTGKADMSFDTQTYMHKDWIASILARADAGPDTLDPLPETVTDISKEPRYSWNFGHFGGSPLTYKFNVAEAKLLRVSLNHGANGPNGESANADMRLALRGPAGAPVVTCKTQAFVSFCEAENPATGEWQAGLMPQAGEGDFQLTVSVF